MTKRALVSTIEGIPTARRVLEIVDSGNEFEVHPSLQWKDCPDDMVEGYVYNSETQTFYIDTTGLEKQIADAGEIDETTHRYVYDEVNNVWTVEALPIE